MHYHFFQFLLGPKKNRRQRLCKVARNIRVFHNFLFTPLPPSPPQFFFNQPLFFKSSRVDYIFISRLLSQEHLKTITYAKRIYGANRVQNGHSKIVKWLIYRCKLKMFRRESSNFSRLSFLQGRAFYWGKWSILVGKQKHNVQKPTSRPQAWNLKGWVIKAKVCD